MSLSSADLTCWHNRNTKTSHARRKTNSSAKFDKNRQSSYEYLNVNMIYNICIYVHMIDVYSVYLYICIVTNYCWDFPAPTLAPFCQTSSGWKQLSNSSSPRHDVTTTHHVPPHVVVASRQMLKPTNDRLDHINLDAAWFSWPRNHEFLPPKMLKHVLKMVCR